MGSGKCALCGKPATHTLGLTRQRLQIDLCSDKCDSEFMRDFGYFGQEYLDQLRKRIEDYKKETEDVE